MCHLHRSTVLLSIRFLSPFSPSSCLGEYKFALPPKPFPHPNSLPVSKTYSSIYYTVHVLIDMEAASQVVEITVISGEDLRVSSRRSVKKNAFVVVRTDSKNSQMTRVDTEGGSYSTWNEKLVMNLPAHARFVTVEVHCKTSSGDRVIGTAMVPVSDFSGGLTPESYMHFLSYRLRNDNGERNGIVNLSVRMKVPERVVPVMAAPPQRMWPETVVGGWDCGGVVVGVPVRSSYRTVQV